MQEVDLATSSFSVPNVRTTLASDNASSATSFADATESWAVLAVRFWYLHDNIKSKYEIRVYHVCYILKLPFNLMELFVGSWFP